MHIVLSIVSEIYIEMLGHLPSSYIDEGDRSRLYELVHYGIDLQLWYLSCKAPSVLSNQCNGRYDPLLPREQRRSLWRQ